MPVPLPLSRSDDNEGFTMTDYNELFRLKAEAFYPEEKALDVIFETGSMMGEEYDRGFETYFDAVEYAEHVLKADVATVSKEYLSDKMWEYLRERGYIYTSMEISSLLKAARLVNEAAA